MCIVPVGVAVTVPPVLALAEPVAELKGLFVDGKLPVVDGDALIDASPGRKRNGLLAENAGLRPNSRTLARYSSIDSPGKGAIRGLGPLGDGGSSPGANNGGSIRLSSNIFPRYLPSMRSNSFRAGISVLSNSAWLTASLSRSIYLRKSSVLMKIFILFHEHSDYQYLR